MTAPAARPPRPRRPARPQFTSTILALESILVLFAALTAHGLDAVPTVPLWTVAGSMCLALMVLSRLVAVPGGYLAGSIAQLLVLASGLVLPMMYLLGLLFIALWVAAYRLGGRIDVERAAFDAAHPEGAR